MAGLITRLLDDLQHPVEIRGFGYPLADLDCPDLTVEQVAQRSQDHVALVGDRKAWGAEV